MKRGFTVNATLWKRMAAFVIDLFIINLAIAYPFRKFFPNRSSFSENYAYFTSSPEALKQITIITLIISMLAILYFAFFEFHLGQTIGKMAFNLKVISQAGELSMWQCLLRNIYLVPLFPFVLMWIIDPIYVFFNPEKQRLTEWLSRTKVIEEVQRGLYR